MPDASPQLLMDTILGHYRTSALKAAIQLDVFTAIAEGAEDVAALAARTGAAARGVEILADYLTIMGFLDKLGGRYRLTPSSAVFLDRRSPAYLGSIERFLAGPEMVGLSLGDPAGFVRNGGSIGLANVAPNDPIWVIFARHMAPLTAPVAEATAGHFATLAESGASAVPGRILDIAAGHGPSALPSVAVFRVPR